MVDRSESCVDPQTLTEVSPYPAYKLGSPNRYYVLWQAVFLEHVVKKCLGLFHGSCKALEGLPGWRYDRESWLDL